MPHCVVNGCRNNNRRIKGSDIVFHQFPNEPSVKKIWIEKCKMSKNIKIKNASVCSVHFVQENYFRDLQSELLGEKPRKKRYLKPDAIPSLYLPHDNVLNELDKKKCKSSISKAKENKSEENMSQPVLNNSEENKSKSASNKSEENKCQSPSNKSEENKCLPPSNNFEENKCLPPSNNSEENKCQTSEGENIGTIPNINIEKESKLASEKNFKKCVSSNMNDSLKLSGLKDQGYFLKISNNSQTLLKNDSISLLEVSKDNFKSDYLNSSIKSSIVSNVTVLPNETLKNNISSSDFDLCYSNKTSITSVLQQSYNKLCSHDKKSLEDESQSTSANNNNSTPHPSEAMLDKCQENNVTDKINAYFSEFFDTPKRNYSQLLKKMSGETNEIVEKPSVNKSTTNILSNENTRKLSTNENPFRSINYNKNIQCDLSDEKLLIKRIPVLETEITNLKELNTTHKIRNKQLLRELYAYKLREKQHKKHFKAEVKAQVKKHLQRYFTDTQVQYFTNNKRVHKWKSEDISQAISLRSIVSKRGYNYLKDKMGFPLPGDTTIKRWKYETKKLNDSNPLLNETQYNNEKTQMEIVLLNHEETGVINEQTIEVGVTHVT